MMTSAQRLISSKPVDARTLRVLTASGATIHDDESNNITQDVYAENSYAGATVDFPMTDAVLCIARGHTQYQRLVEPFAENVPVFRNVQRVLVPVMRRSLKCHELFGFLKRGLATLNLELMTGAILEAGEWCPPTRTQRSNCLDLYEALELLDATGVELRRALFGFDQIGDFQLELDGFYHAEEDKPRQYVCPPFVIQDVLESLDGTGYYFKIAVWVNVGGEQRMHVIVVDNLTMQTPTELGKALLRGLPIVVRAAKMGRLVSTLAAVALREHKPRTYLRREGWVYGREHRLIGCLAGREMVTAPGQDVSGFEVSPEEPLLYRQGTLEGWNEQVLNSLKASPVMLGGIQLGLAGMMLELAPDASAAMFTFFGGAGLGKSLTLSAIASLFGNPTSPGRPKQGLGKLMISTFSSSQKALQGMARKATLAPLLVDELGSNDFGDLDRFLYTIGNGAGRNLADGAGGVIESGSRPVFLITTGEVASLELISRNAKQGVRDRAIDIHIGGNVTAIPRAMQPEDAEQPPPLLPVKSRQALVAGLRSEYGSVAPAFAEAVMEVVEENDLGELLAELRQQIAERIWFVSGDGAERVIARFALAALAGYIAVQYDIFTHVDEDEALEAVFHCAKAWTEVRWSHLIVLRAALLAHGSFWAHDEEEVQLGQGKPDGLQRHKQEHAGWPTILVEKTSFEALISPLDATIIGKRLVEDNIIHRHEGERNTVGKPPKYHIRTNWLSGFGVSWNGAECRFEECGHTALASRSNI